MRYIKRVMFFFSFFLLLSPFAAAAFPGEGPPLNGAPELYAYEPIAYLDHFYAVMPLQEPYQDLSKTPYKFLKADFSALGWTFDSEYEDKFEVCYLNKSGANRRPEVFVQGAQFSKPLSFYREDWDPGGWVTVGGRTAYWSSSKVTSGVLASRIVIFVPELDLAEGGAAFFGVTIRLDVPSGNVTKEFEDATVAGILDSLGKIKLSVVDPEAPGLPGASGSVTTQAGKTPGDDASASVDLPTAVAVGVAAAVVSVLGAAAAGSTATAGSAAAGGVSGGGGSSAGRSGEGKRREEGEEAPPVLRMIISKNFGDTIRYGDPHVFVYARIVELREGSELARPDLTSQISISASSELDLGPAQMAGDSMGAAVRAPGYMGSKPTVQATISFTLAAGTAHFANNVIFNLIDEAEIQMADSCNLLESIRGLRDECEMPYELVNFFDLESAQVTFEMKDDDLPFSIELVEESLGKGKLVLVNLSGHVHNGKMFTPYFGKLTATSNQEEVEKSFLVNLCRDGIYVDFGEWEEAELKFYYEPDTNEMIENRFLVGLATFDYGQRRLIVEPPKDLMLDVVDKGQIAKKIGYEVEIMPQPVPGRFADYQLFTDCRLTAKKPLPYSDKIPATLEMRYIFEDEMYLKEEGVALKPDYVWYLDEFDAQFEALHNKFAAYFSHPVAGSAMRELERIRSQMSLSDLQLYERYFLAQLQKILEESQVAAMAEANYWDWAVYGLEVAVFLGDICADILATIYGGPFGVIVADGAKDIIIEVGRGMLSEPNFSIQRIPGITWDAAVKATTKNIDGFLEFPKPPEYKKIVIWYTLFTAYRFFWHWYFDVDPVTKKPLGIENAVRMAVRDVTLKAAMEAGLKDFLKQYTTQGMDMKAAPSAATVPAQSGAEAFNQLTTEAMEAFVSLLEYVSNTATDALYEMFKMSGII